MGALGLFTFSQRTVHNIRISELAVPVYSFLVGVSFAGSILYNVRTYDGSSLSFYSLNYEILTSLAVVDKTCTL